MKKGGFTLLETIVAISVLVLATVGPMTLAADSIRNASLFRHQTIAYFLAEEAAEYIHNQITSNSLEGESWLSRLGPCLGADGCIIDATDSPANAVASCLGQCPYLQFSGLPKGLYGYESGWANTIFRRTLRITEVTPDQEIKVTIVVEWLHTNALRQATIEDHLFNWR